MVAHNTHKDPKAVPFAAAVHTRTHTNTLSGCRLECSGGWGRTDARLCVWLNGNTIRCVPVVCFAYTAAAAGRCEPKKQRCSSEQQLRTMVTLTLSLCYSSSHALLLPLFELCSAANKLKGLRRYAKFRRWFWWKCRTISKTFVCFGQKICSLNICLNILCANMCVICRVYKYNNGKPKFLHIYKYDVCA